MDGQQSVVLATEEKDEEICTVWAALNMDRRDSKDTLSPLFDAS
jgi:hypothetical protein